MKAPTMNPPGFTPLCGPLGFYPVVPDADWVIRLLHWGVRTVQLRFKPLAHDAAAVAQQVRAAVAAGRNVAGAQVFINDHWEQALAQGAYGVHLGQEDWAALGSAERERLRASDMRLGLSTHTPAELASAQAARPSYLAIGPVYPTTLKAMPYEAVGLERLRLWTQQARPCPVVAIGGISLERLPAVLACGVDGVAVVSAVTQAQDPQAACSAFSRTWVAAQGSSWP
jgi:thiamine-phosphate diphosphorylase